MVSKQDIDKRKAEVKSKANTSKPKESKTERFLRLATKRVSSVLKSFRILGNCSSRHNYAYSSEQIDKMFEVLQVALNNTEAKFTPSKQEQKSFKF